MTCEYKCPEFEKGDCSAFRRYFGKSAGEKIQCEIPAELRGDCPMIAVLHQTRSWAQGYGDYGKMVAEIAKNLGALTVAVVTKPFSFEGAQRTEIAKDSQRLLKEKVDTLITISNDKLLSILEPKTTVLNAFWACDEILRQAVQGISAFIVLPGIINIDFADVKAVMKDSGSALFGIGKAKGQDRAKEAARKALTSPLLDISCKGAKGVLFNVSGGKDITLSEVDEVAKIITQEVSPEAKIIFGAIQDEKLPKGEIKVTVIATGF